MRGVFVDTNIIIDYSKGFGKNLKNLFLLQKQKHLQIFINPIVITEFFTDKGLIVEDNFARALRLFQIFKIIDVTTKDGYLAGEILRTNQIIFLPDALIAATCINNELELATNNQKDFKKVKKLKLFENNS